MKDAIDQIYDQVCHSDMFAQALMGISTIRGNYFYRKIERAYGIGWLRNTTQCNCLYAHYLLNDAQTWLFQPNGQQQGVGRQQLDNGMAELNSLIGLGVVKKEAGSLRNLIMIQPLRMQQGLSNTNMCYPMVLTGEPITNKTTMAYHQHLRSA